MNEPTVVRELNDLVERAESLRDAPGRTLLGITGPPGSGKSTLAAEVVRRLGSDGIVVPMDGFHLSNEELTARGLADRKGAPATFDAAGYATLLQRLRTADRPLAAPGFDRDAEETIPDAIAVDPTVRLIVTEGNYLLLDEAPWSRLAEILDEIWYVDSDQQTRLRRLVRRHMQHGKAAVDASRWATGSDERNAELVETTRPRADLVADLGVVS